jgi:hypothetical protein
MNKDEYLEKVKDLMLNVQDALAKYQNIGFENIDTFYDILLMHLGH